MLPIAPAARYSSVQTHRNNSIAIFDELASTSDYLREHSELWPQNFYTVSARSQTAGRGRLRRSWQMQAGQDLAFTMVYHFHGEFKYVGGLTPYIGYALKEILTPLAQKELLLKWPNDIFGDGKKICGILCENVGELQSNNARIILIGVGVNVNSDARSNDKAAISLKELSGTNFDLEALRIAIVTQLAERLLRLRIPYADDFCEAWYRACAHRQALVSWQGENSQLCTGRVSGIDGEGRLLIEDRAGGMHAVTREIE